MKTSTFCGNLSCSRRLNASLVIVAAGCVLAKLSSKKMRRDSDSAKVGSRPTNEHQGPCTTANE
jgi:hypothetical protein